MADTWNPAQYDKFQQEREQPFFDLLGMIAPRGTPRIVDLGCGTGRMTRVLHERTQARETVGIDNSPRMLEQGLAAAGNGLRFELGTIESFPGERGAFDIIFSNAALHWIPDHPALLERLSRALTPGGQLAFQVPAQHDTASHLVADELEDVEPFRSALGGWHRTVSVLRPEEYARLLYRYGFGNPEVRLIVYPHVLAEPASAIEWMKGTLLAEYARRLPVELYDRFVDEYRTRLLARIEDTRPYFFPFKRILCWGQRA